MLDMFSLRYLDVWPKNSQKEKTKPEKVFGRLGLYIQVFSKKNYWGIRGRFPCLIHILQMASKPPAKNTVFFLWPVDSFRRDSRRRCETASQTWRGLDVPGLLKWVSFFFLRSCGVVCDGNYSLKNAQGSGRGSFAEGCPSRKVAEGDVGEIRHTIWIWISWCSSVSMSCIGIWFWHELFPNHTYSRLCGFSYRFCFGVSRKPRGSFAEAPRKEHMPKQRYSPPMPWQSPSPRQTNVANEKGQKWQQMQAHKAKMKENVVALWSRKQELRKQGRGSSRKGYMWNVCRGSWRCGRGSCCGSGE